MSNNNKRELIRKAEVIIGKLVALQGASNGSITLQEATRKVRYFIDNEIRK